MIKHIVCWKIKEGLDKEDVLKEIKKILSSLKTEIPEIVSLEIYFNAPGAPSANHDVVLVSEFESLNSLSVYQAHPAHVKVASYIKSVTEQRAAVDYNY